MQKMWGVFESIIKSEGATALTNERIKKCCEENGFDYEEFSASVIEKVLSVIGAHSENSGDVLLSELSSKNLEKVYGGSGFFQRGTASALAVLSLCGATQLPASAVKEKDRQVLLQERVASRHLQKRSEADSVIKSQTAQNIVKYLLTAGLGSFLTYLLMSQRNGESSTNASAPGQTTDLGHPLPERKANIPVKLHFTHCNGFLPDITEPSARAWFDISGRRVTPYTSKRDGQLFRIGAFFDTLAYCKDTLGFSVQRTGETEYTANDVWVLPKEYQEKPPVVINKEVKSVRVTTPLDPSKCANILITNGRSLQSMVFISQIKGETFDISKSAVLDFANFFYPGGEPFEGRFAQEESLCRITNLYPLLCNESVKDAFYDPHRRLEHKTKNKDLTYWKSIGTFRDCIYVPNVKQIKNDYGASRIGGFINGPTFNVIAAAAPDLRESKGLVETKSEKYRECFKNLWRQIIGTACKNQNKNLIAGAIGCSAFRNDPQVAAETFFEVFLKEGPTESACWATHFKHLILANYIYDIKDAFNYVWFFNTATSNEYEGLDIKLINLYCPE